MIIGVDVNLRRVTMCRLLPERKLDFVTYTVPEITPSLECPRLMAASIRGAGRVAMSDVVWIERPMGMHIRSVADLCRVMGAVLAVMPIATSIEEVTAPEWKKLIGLSGNAGKVEVKGWALDELLRRGVTIDVGSLNEHQCDALAIAVACERESQRATEHEGQVIA